MSAPAVEEAASAPPVPIRRVDRIVGSIMAVCIGATLGAMIGSRIAGTDEPLPDRAEVLAIAEVVWNEREPDESWVTEEPVENLDSRTEHEDIMGVPGWVQVLFGDATMEKTTGVYWPDRPGWVESTDEPYDYPETPEDNARRLDEAAARLTAAGWDVSRPYFHTVEGRRGTLVVSFTASDGSTPDMEVARVPPPVHTWSVAAGAVLGALAGCAAVAAFVRHRRSHPPAGTTLLGMAGLALLSVNAAMAAMSVGFQLAYAGEIGGPLWREARFIPFGASMNVGLLLLAVSAVALWRQRLTRAE
ncbi:hypothetical protein AB0I28_33280 [Phytomonospora sp. NPDC050363]|uniref:hypothetical protein n=1 Tax=Phytomonospora sp. NPDC050363 TaxID=3155642 RepID=UPI0033C51057